MRFIHFETIDSTNTWLKNSWEDQPDMTFVSADYQSQGRGRRQRSWTSPKGESLMFSLLIRDEQLLKRHQLVSLVSALSIVRLLQQRGVSDVTVKWPNDVYAGGRKICGILLEGVSQPELQCLIVGIGLNVNQQAFAGEYRHEPVSLYQLTGRRSDISRLRQQAYQLLTEELAKLKADEDFSKVLQSHDYLKGRRVLAEIGQETREVSVIGINPDGSLRIRADGRETDITSGEISFRV